MIDLFFLKTTACILIKAPNCFSCKIMTDKWSGLGLGYGFVEYQNPAMAQRAISTLNGYRYVMCVGGGENQSCPHLFIFRVQNKSLKVSIARPSSAAITNANLYIKVRYYLFTLFARTHINLPTCIHYANLPSCVHTYIRTCSFFFPHAPGPPKQHHTRRSSCSLQQIWRYHCCASACPSYG